MKALLLAPLWLALCACPGQTVLSTPNSCSVLIPQSWRAGVAAPELPADDQVGSWIVFGDSAIGKLDQANGRVKDSIDIISRCESRDKIAVERATRRKFLGIF